MFAFVLSDNFLIYIDPRVRQITSLDANSEIDIPYNVTVFEAETIEFWIKLYTPTLTDTVVLVSQTLHFNFSFAISHFNFEVQSVIIPMNSLVLTDDQLGSWIYIAAVIGLNEINSYMIVDDSLPVQGSPAGLLGNYQSNPLKIFAQSSGSVNFIAGIKELRIWLQYKTYTELQGSRYITPSNIAPGLVLYFPMDESSGNIITEIVSGLTLTVNNTFWSPDPEYSTIANGSSPSYIRNNVAILLPDTSTCLNMNLPNATWVYDEFTFMIWIKMSNIGQLNMNYTGVTFFSVMIDLTKSSGNIITTWKANKDTSKTSTLQVKQWQSYAYTVGIQGHPTYVNGIEINTDAGIVLIYKLTLI